MDTCIAALLSTFLSLLIGALTFPWSAGEMAQWVTVLVAKLEDQSLIPKTHMIEGEN